MPRDPFWILLLLLPPLLIFPNLGSSFLWQDEAETALLAERVAQHGYPLADDGRGPAITDQEGRLDLNDDGVWIWSPWLDKYVAAAGLKLVGHSAFAARLPFALLGWAVLLLSYAALVDITGRRGTSRVALLLLMSSVWFLVYVRQCRYYSPLMLASVLHLWGYVRMARGRRGGLAMFVAGGAGLFQTFYPQLIASTAAMILHRPWAQKGGALLRRFAVGCALIGALSLPFFIYIRGWSRDYEGAGYGFDGLWRYGSSLRAYLLLLHSYAWPFLFAAPPAALALVRARGGIERACAAALLLVGLALPVLLTAHPGPLTLCALLAAVGLAGLVGLAWLVRNPRERSAAWVELFAWLAVCTTVLSAGVASFPFFRYLLGALPVFAFATAATIQGLAGRRLWLAVPLVAVAALTNVLHAVPFQAVLATIGPKGEIDEEQLKAATGFGHSPTNGVSLTILVGPARDEAEAFRFLFGRYLSELTNDYDGPLEGTWRHIEPMCGPRDRLVTTYEHFTLMFHTDLEIHRDFELESLPELPEWIVIHSPRVPRFPPQLWDVINAGSTILIGGEARRYVRVDLDVAEIPWENIPEPFWHRFTTVRPDPAPRVLVFHLELDR